MDCDRHTVARWQQWMRTTVDATKAVYGTAARGINKVDAYAALRRVLHRVMHQLPNVSPETVWREYRDRTYPEPALHSITLPSATNNSSVTLAEVFKAMASPSSPAPALVQRVVGMYACFKDPPGSDAAVMPHVVSFVREVLLEAPAPKLVTCPTLMVVVAKFVQQLADQDCPIMPFTAGEQPPPPPKEWALNSLIWYFLYYAQRLTHDVMRREAVELVQVIVDTAKTIYDNALSVHDLLGVFKPHRVRESDGYFALNGNMQAHPHIVKVTGTGAHNTSSSNKPSYKKDSVAAKGCCPVMAAVCPHSVVYALAVVRGCEGVTDVTRLLCFFPKPQALVYDNAAALLAHLLNSDYGSYRNCVVFFDGFHQSGHPTASTVFCGVLSALFNINTSAAEGLWASVRKSACVLLPLTRMLAAQGVDSVLAPYDPSRVHAAHSLLRCPPQRTRLL